MILTLIRIKKFLENTKVLFRAKHYLSRELYSENLKKIKNLKNKYKNKRCFIIGGSPSLSQLDLSFLNDEFTFTVGRGYKLKEKNLKHSNFHVLSDTLGYCEFYKEIDENFSDIYWVYQAIPFINHVEESIFFNYWNSPNATKFFQFDITKPLYVSYSVVHFALQIAVYLGFTEIYFIGVDMNFANVSGHAYKESDDEQKRQLKYSISSEYTMLKSLDYATKLLKKKGVHLYNASPCGNLNCMERVKYNELFK